MNVEEGIKMVISGGIITPKFLKNKKNKNWFKNIYNNRMYYQDPIGYFYLREQKNRNELLCFQKLVLEDMKIIVIKIFGK
jgi:hypothetical protein